MKAKKNALRVLLHSFGRYLTDSVWKASQVRHMVGNRYRVIYMGHIYYVNIATGHVR